MRALPSKLRRNYVPGAPLFAQRPLKFRGVPYQKHDALPIAEMSKVRHHRLWMSGLASHEKHGPFDKRKAKAAAPEGFAAGGSFTVPQAATEPVPFTQEHPGERVHVETPVQQSKRRRS